MRSKKPLALNFRDVDTKVGVTRETAEKVAETLGLSLTGAIHYAINRMARELNILEESGELRHPLFDVTPSGSEVIDALKAKQKL